ncbi:predicted protein [Uncinocarpus reesii 1704]|uniref:Uncharacterized protein n=1 Tax=Uncinocarpus reesii (strain UAMH 1704) TaxID=336963 RepID=C4JJT7_UNCRE|nr:uncharacterized protein UREG_01894 [Uncinocarpus reesii 1704]EEP77045.1 predicted protein [Uncinocarpus reesii 1704]
MQFARKVLNHVFHDDVRCFYLVESNVCPASREGFKTKLQEDEYFESDFINASEEQCKSWALEKEFQVNFIEQDLIAIVDARSARDETILMCHYNYLRDPGDGLEFGDFGVLPREPNVWYDFRIDYRGAHMVCVALHYVPPDLSYPAYFGCKEKFTDEHGVFDVQKALRYGLDPDGSETQVEP